MLYFFTLLEMLIAFIKKNSKVITFVLLATMFIIATFSSETADFTIYEGRYYHYDVAFLYDQTEPLYTLIIKMARFLNLPYRLFLGIEYAIIIISFSCFVKKFSNNYNWILVLYLIWPFCRDVVVLRTTLGAAFVYIGFNFLLKDGKKNLLKYIICVLIAGLIHYSMFFFLIMAAIEIIKSRENVTENRLLVIFFVIFVIELVVFKVFPQLPFTGRMMNKINYVLSRQTDVTNLVSAPGTVRTVFMFAIYYLLHIQVHQKVKARNEIDKVKLSEKIFYVNLYVLLIIPLLSYVPDLWRLQQILALLCYVEFSFYFSNSKNRKTTKNELIFFIECIIYALTYLFIIVLKTDQLDTVFRALFENNILFR